MTRFLLPLVLAASLAALLAASAAPARTTTARCGSKSTRHGYVNRIRATRTTCRTARSVALAFNACRARHHRGTGCRRQLGWSCTTSHRVSGVGQFYENARCTRRRGVVGFLNSVNT